MDVQVMDYIAAMKRGRYCQSGPRFLLIVSSVACAPAAVWGELPQYHIAQLARRISGAYLTPRAEHLKTMTANIEAGRFIEPLTAAKAMDEDTLKKDLSGT